MDQTSREIQKDNDDLLWTWIREHGGLYRDRERWDSHLSPEQNRRLFRFLDRADGRGHHLDELASEIGSMFPGYGIYESSDLWNWLQTSRVNGGDVLCERLGIGWAA